MTDTRTLIERTTQAIADLEQARADWKGRLYMPRLEAAQGNLVQLLRDLLAALPQAQAIKVWTVAQACGPDAPFEYDQGDVVLVGYDELYDLVHPLPQAHETNKEGLCRSRNVGGAVDCAGNSSNAARSAPSAVVIARAWLDRQIVRDGREPMLDEGDCRLCGGPGGHEPTDPCGIVFSLVRELEAAAPPAPDARLRGLLTELRDEAMSPNLSAREAGIVTAIVGRVEASLRAHEGEK